MSAPSSRPSCRVAAISAHVVSFTGLVRDFNERPEVQALTLEHYPGMTEGGTRSDREDAEGRWSLQGVSLFTGGMPGTRRPYRAGGGRQRASSCGLRGLRFHHGLSQNARSLLEEGTHCERQLLGRRTLERSSRCRALGGLLMNKLIDDFGRRVSYVRISVTDRCDFRCVYCMSEEMTFLPRAQVLTLEELEMVARAFVEIGRREDSPDRGRTSGQAWTSISWSVISARCPASRISP